MNAGPESLGVHIDRPFPYHTFISCSDKSDEILASETSSNSLSVDHVTMRLQHMTMWEPSALMPSDEPAWILTSLKLTTAPDSQKSEKQLTSTISESSAVPPDHPEKPLKPQFKQARGAVEEDGQEMLLISNEVSDFPLEQSEESREEDLYQRQVRALDGITDDDLISLQGEKDENSIRALYAAFATRDTAVIKLLVAPNLRWVFDGPACHQYMKELLTESLTPLAGIFRPLGVKAFSDQIFVEGRVPRWGTYWVHVWTVERSGGYLVKLEEYWDTAVTVRDTSSCRSRERSVIWESFLSKITSKLPSRNAHAISQLIIDI